jgi:two-component system, OmpR family, response regulator
VRSTRSRPNAVLGTAHVLVIGDEPVTINLLRSELRAAGCEVTGELDWIEGKRRALADDVALVVLGRMGSGSDGLDVLMGMRRHQPAVPIIVLSAQAELSDRLAAFEAGATDFLAKPFAPGELVARVRAQLRRAACTWTDRGCN